MNIERRCFAVQELRAEKVEDKMIVRGHAAVFNSWSENLGGFREIILPGAFSDSLSRGDEVLATFHHKRHMVLGTTFNKSLSLSEDDTGLAVRMVLPDTQDGRDTFVLVNDKYVRGWSFAFPTPAAGDQEWRRGQAGAPDERTLKRIKLMDVSLTPDPAYLAASDAEVVKRSHEDFVADFCTKCGTELTSIGMPERRYCEHCERHGYPLSLAKARLALA